MTEITPILTEVVAQFTALGVLPYILAGAVVGLIGYFIRQAKKAGR